MNKTLEEAFTLIENMASHHFQWSSERVVSPQKPGMYQLNSQDALAAQVEILNKTIAQLQVNMSHGNTSSVSSVQSSPVCTICGVHGHLQGECLVYTKSEASVSEVNYAQNQGPFSQNYNPQWRHHPNLSYKSNLPSQSSFSSSVSHPGFSQ